MTLTYMSLFSGIGGLDLGLDRAGMTCVAQVENDPFCQRVLEKHWPEVPKHDDVRTTGDWWQSEPRPTVDLIAGGFPCQPFSGAGRQLGMDDERWGWPWMESVIRRVRPRYVLVENVAALLRDAGAWGTVLADLHHLGFDAEWSIVSACSVGAPHMRRRVFCLAYPRGEGLQGVHETGGAIHLQPAPGALRRHWASEPQVARVADGVPRRLVRDPIHAYGNVVIPQVAEHIGRFIVASAEGVRAQAVRG